MNWTPSSLTWTTLALVSAVALALPTSAAAPGADATSENVVHERPPAQNPCQTQLVADLRQCENLFCPGRSSCNRPLLTMCIAGARTAFDQCMRDL